MNKPLKKPYGLEFHMIALLVLVGITALVNWQAKIIGLYQDDLYLWVRFANHKALGLIFQTGTSRFRFIWEFFGWLELKTIGTHTEWLVPVNIAVNGFIAWAVYLICLHFSKNRRIALILGAAYALSRFSYYQISMVLGLMEALALVTALGLLYCLYEYLNEKNGKNRYLAAALFLYFAVVFIHERYMVLVLLILLVMLLKKDYKKIPFPILLFALIQLIRYITIGTISPPGTAGTNVADTFSVSQGLAFSLQQVAYVFGINLGPEHLCSIPWSETVSGIRYLILINIVVLAVICGIFAAVLVLDQKNRKTHIQNLTLFVVFIALCIGSSSVTVRVEMRWVYVSYSAALCVLAYLYGAVKKYAVSQSTWTGLSHVCGILILTYLIILIPVEGYYQDARDGLYYYSNQRRMNSLAEQTYGKYGKELFDKKIYVLNNTFEIDDWTFKNFFRVYQKERTPAVPPVTVIDSVDQLGLIEEDMLILAEDRKDNTYLDITEYLKEQKLKLEQGYYRDGWLDQHGEFTVQAGASGIIVLNCYYPGQLKGTETAVVRRDGTEILKIEMTKQNEIYSIQAEPYEKLHLTIDCNFCYEAAPEIRGCDKLAMVVKLTAE